MSTEPKLIQHHNIISDISFKFKAGVLITNRFLKDSIHRPIKFPNNNTLNSASTIALSESNLWNADDNDSNRILTAGKVENLRIAARKLNGVEVIAGEIFSFWKHVGMPSKRQGFVVGREIKEGCIVPTIAGGLCQLSNALYDAALKAGFEIIERHKHTHVIKGSLAEYDRDATVKWNYVDLRFRSTSDFKIMIDFTPEKLIVQFKSDKKIDETINKDILLFTPSKLNDCYSCGNTLCFKYPGEVEQVKQKQVTTFILDEKWPEFNKYVKTIITDDDHLIVPFAPKNQFKIERYTWGIGKASHTKSYFLKALMRSISIRRASKLGLNIPSIYLKYDESIAKKLKFAIPVKTTHIVIAQNLLPFAYKEGIFGGRTYDVLMTRLPMEILHQKLDDAQIHYSDSKTLNDFRAGKELVELESMALTKSNHIITPHQQIADIFNNKSMKLNWVMPMVNNSNGLKGNKILFPASALARKGAYEIRRLAAELDLDLIVAGKAIENDGFWGDVKVSTTGSDIFNNIGLVILPAYIEHQPRLLLKALALNIPIITTPACGLPAQDGLTIVPEGDYLNLKDAVLEVLNKVLTLASVAN